MEPDSILDPAQMEEHFAKRDAMQSMEDEHQLIRQFKLFRMQFRDAHNGVETQIQQLLYEKTFYGSFDDEICKWVEAAMDEEDKRYHAYRASVKEFLIQQVARIRRGPSEEQEDA